MLYVPPVGTSRTREERIARSRTRDRAQKKFWQTIFGLLLLAPASSIIAQSQSFQIWPEIDTYLKVNANVRLSFFAATTREERRGTDAEIGPNIDVYGKPLLKAKRFAVFDLDQSKNRLFIFRIGYRYMPSTNGPLENRIILEGTGRYPLLRSTIVSDRNRADLRFIDQVFSWRYRNRLTVEHEFAIRSYHFAPYVRAEAYYDSPTSKFSRTAETAGCPFPIRKHFEIEPYFEHQNDTSKSPNRQVNAFGLVLSLYFKN